ncbi:hypothetical protein BN1013_00245 [Candidatus Rubidus massiliensis]|nr:MAG: hypothetical protein BGO10_08155 [Chlamydia sp. 32-24]CDZ79749.1 hypothetical protein BN1013_00245 [Candidatus Rubidus massiliensis]
MINLTNIFQSYILKIGPIYRERCKFLDYFLIHNTIVHNMRIFTLLFLLCFISLTTSCGRLAERFGGVPAHKCCGKRNPRIPKGEEEYVQEATRIMITYAEKIRKPMRFHLEHSYVYHDEIARKIDGFRMEFISQDIVEVREAREALVDLVEGFLEDVNSDPILAKNLPRPITPSDLEIYINYESYWTLYGDPLYVGWTLLQDGTAFYYAGDIKNRRIDYWHSRVEPYYKSYQTVAFSREAKNTEAFNNRQEGANKRESKVIGLQEMLYRDDIDANDLEHPYQHH